MITTYRYFYFVQVYLCENLLPSGCSSPNSSDLPTCRLVAVKVLHRDADDQTRFVPSTSYRIVLPPTFLLKCFFSHFLTTVLTFEFEVKLCLVMSYQTYDSLFGQRIKSCHFFLSRERQEVPSCACLRAHDCQCL